MSFDSTPFQKSGFSRRAFLRGSGVALLGGMAWYLTGCGSGSNEADDEATPAATALPVGKITPMLLAGEFVANTNNRFLVGLLHENGDFVRNAKVYAKFYSAEEGSTTGVLRGEDEMKFVELNDPNAHEFDSSGSQDASETSVPFYVLGAPFDRAGTWAVELSATLEDGAQAEAIQASFKVLAEPATPALLTVPPASLNDTVATNPDPASLCTRDPICPLHDIVIGDVLGKGRPLVVQFSTPAFCETRFCGPVLEVLLKGAEPYRDRVDFVHIEVWRDREAALYRPAMLEWKLESEPYTFFMDATGKVVGKLEAIFSEEELASALEQLVAL